ncbi:hypothetical protein GQ55_9G068800 [Panicum hallii var. hallii]|uniref:Uncharacterized protein n=1 Tax=Panicum hallii var. hallii TaxID=1504633 RepID=A0A2T7C0F9_9POAL|nr:hypothetical protein GQ55_9G068800 [Panicum hallii var. hallii]
MQPSTSTSVCPAPDQFIITTTRAQVRPSVRAKTPARDRENPMRGGRIGESVLYMPAVLLRHERGEPQGCARRDTGGLLVLLQRRRHHHRRGKGVPRDEPAQREEPARLAEAARERVGLGVEPHVLAAHREAVPRQGPQPLLQRLLLGAEPRRRAAELLQPLLLSLARPPRRQPVGLLAPLPPLLLLVRHLGLLLPRRRLRRGRPRRHHLVQARARVGPPRREPARDNVHAHVPRAAAGRRGSEVKVKGFLHGQHLLALQLQPSTTTENRRRISRKLRGASRESGKREER